jgi:hypothetical protein
MSCIPESGGCERRFTDPFVGYLNEVKGAGYAFRECLDIKDRQGSQPEALYFDAVQNRVLVVERKSISWPTDYSHRHSNDHYVADLFVEELKPCRFDNDLYEISLPLLIEGSKRDLRPFVAEAAKKIRSRKLQAESGLVIREQVNEKWWWAFRKVPGWDREDGEPSTGLKFSWNGPITRFTDYIEPTELPGALTRCFDKIFSDCVKKFSTYSDAERILLLDPHGDLQHQEVDWWKAVFSKHPPPAMIGEIWSGTFDDEWEGWTFHRFH